MKPIISTAPICTSNPIKAVSYAGYRYPPQVISYTVWLYFRFPLSLRMVEEILAQRGIDVSYETVRCWALTFGQRAAKNIRTLALAKGDKWHLDEVVVTIKGKPCWLWRGVDQNGGVIDVLVQTTRDKEAAERLLRKLIKKQMGLPRVIITDKLRSYAAATRALGIIREHRQHKGLNNRAENSHQPTRVREKVMRRFKSTRQLQRFCSTHDQINNLFQHCRYHLDAQAKRNNREVAFARWHQMTGLATSPTAAL